MEGASMCMHDGRMPVDPEDTNKTASGTYKCAVKEVYVSLAFTSPAWLKRGEARGALSRLRLHGLEGRQSIPVCERMEAGRLNIMLEVTT